VAQEKPAVEVLLEVGCGHSEDHCTQCVLKAMESYASQQVQKARREDAEIVRELSVFAKILGTPFDIREEVAQAIEAKAKEAK